MELIDGLISAALSFLSNADCGIIKENLIISNPCLESSTDLRIVQQLRVSYKLLGFSATDPLPTNPESQSLAISERLHFQYFAMFLLGPCLCTYGHSSSLIQDNITCKALLTPPNWDRSPSRGFLPFIANLPCAAIFVDLFFSLMRLKANSVSYYSWYSTNVFLS